MGLLHCLADTSSVSLDELPICLNVAFISFKRCLSLAFVSRNLRQKEGERITTNKNSSPNYDYCQTVHR